MKPVPEPEEEDDPLDAFMAGIDNQVLKEAEKPSEEKVCLLFHLETMRKSEL